MHGYYFPAQFSSGYQNVQPQPPPPPPHEELVGMPPPPYTPVADAASSLPESTSVEGNGTLDKKSPTSPSEGGND